MRTIDFNTIIEQAWAGYDDTKKVTSIQDVSARVSTNHVFKVSFDERPSVFAKLSYYGNFDHFKEEHVIINNLANNLGTPYENFLARSLVKKNEVYTYRYKQDALDAWVVFYNPIRIRKKFPPILEEKQIKKLGSELAHFHKACYNLRNVLPASSKTIISDIEQLLSMLDKEIIGCNYRGHENQIRTQCIQFLENATQLNYNSFVPIPVFIDWNIGNFSVTGDGKFFSRWDYDWFRVSTRVMDFYFFARVVSSIGDRTVFTYSADPLMEERFLIFLKEYHKVYPLTSDEVLFMKEAYRFFILNYVIKDGNFFFHQIYASKLQKEAYETHFPALEYKFNAEILLKALKL